MMTIGLIQLTGLQLSLKIGVEAWERCTPKKVMLDLEMASSNGEASSSDALEDTLDYSKVSNRTR